MIEGCGIRPDRPDDLTLHAVRGNASGDCVVLIA